MSIPLTKYQVNGNDLFSGVDGPGAPPNGGATGYVVNGTNLFTYYNNQGSNYQSNLSKFNYIYLGTPFDIMLFNYFSKAVIGTPGNATLNKINNRLCWKIINTTNFKFNFPYATTIYYVAIGGGQSGSANGGQGGGLIFGTFTSSDLLTIVIGAGGANTTITGTNISITANAGPGLGSASGLQVGTYTAVTGGVGGTTYTGGNGLFISNLGIYSGGGGGGQDSSSSGSGFAGGVAGGGTGGDYSSTSGTAGAPNTGGGGGAAAGGTGGPGAGGSGVVYLYL